MKKLLFALAILSFAVFQSGCKKSKCTNVSCYNGGTCDENTGQCKCTANFTGASCSEVNGDTVAYLIMKFHFDSTMTRLDNFGNPTTMPSGHAGQHPNFKGLSQHYIELAQSAYTQLGTGVILYHAPETTIGGANAIDFEQNTIVKNDSIFFKIPLKSVTPGTYEYVRVSLAYQNYEVKFLLDTSINVGGTNYPIKQEFPCNVASFVGFNTYIKNYTMHNQSVTVNGNRLQGYWGAESYGTIYGYPFDQVNTGQTPAGLTTVVNPLFSTSPIPAGSCVATAKFEPGKLVVTGNETKSVVVNVSVSTNKSFEWNDVVPDGKWEPAKGENVVDMGIRGIKPVIQ
ncbi:MAG: calcium-binding EGF-like domain-containing protein [Chitinophagales bacterium]